jgi:hypothetical protein
MLDGPAAVRAHHDQVNRVAPRRADDLDERLAQAQCPMHVELLCVGVRQHLVEPLAGVHL